LKLQISSRPARAAALLAIVVRMFIDLTVDQAIHNAGWAAALLGGILATPWILGVIQVRRNKAGLPLLLRLALLMATLLDASLSLASVVRSAGYLTLEHVSYFYLLIPASLVALWCVLKNGNAIGYGAMVWIRVFPVVILIIVILQFRHYSPAWLCPLLGNGLWETGIYGIQCSGRIMIASGILLTVEDSDNQAEALRPHLRMLTAAVGMSSLLIVLRLMMTPTMIRGAQSWFARLHSLLVNGRALLYLQMPMITLWLTGLMHLLVCESFVATASLQSLVPRLDGKWSALTVMLTVAALSVYSLFGNGLAISLSVWSAVLLPGLLGFTLFHWTHIGGSSCAD